MSFNWFLLVPILGIVGATICGSLAIHARHKQRIVILKTGIKPEEKPYRRERLLIGGSSMIGIGLGLLRGLSATNIGLTSGCVFLFIGIAVTVVALFFVKKSTPSSQQITQRREIMRALLDQLRHFRRAHPYVEITLIADPKVKGDIEQIIDDELLEFREENQEGPTYIPIDKIVSVRRIPETQPETQ